MFKREKKGRPPKTTRISWLQSNICYVSSMRRLISNVATYCNVVLSGTNLDSHADTIVSGRNFMVANYTNRVCDMSPYSDEYNPVKGVPAVHAATGYTTNTGDNYILILNKALWVTNLGHIIINPNQIFHNGVEVQYNHHAKDLMSIQIHLDNFTACIESARNNIHLTT